MKQLYASAIRKASEIRLKLGLNLFQPINVYDICARLELDVQFLDLNMEGLYVNNAGTPKIILSSLRPFSRRVFTCGHELGHHVFNHGLKLDTISEENDSSYKSNDEILVDSFAASLLMPVGGIEVEFEKRNLKFHSATSVDYYIISSLFGVGYQTLIIHCRISNLINEAKYIELGKLTPAKIFKREFGDLGEPTHFKIIDGISKISPIDLEVSNYLSLPNHFSVEDGFLEKQKESPLGTLYLAKKAGIFSVHSGNSEVSYFVRIQPQNYIGFAEYRHFEN